MQIVSVEQRAVGIIAPFVDKNRIDQIMTGGMSSCYALSLRDPRVEVALLAHVDPIRGLSLARMINQTVPIMRGLGARTLICETANLKGKPNWQLDALGSVLNSIGRFGLRLEFNVDKTGELFLDRGKATGVVLDPASGLKLYSFMERLPKPTYPVTKLNTAQRLWREVQKVGRIFSNPDFLLQYTPSVSND